MLLDWLTLCGYSVLFFLLDLLALLILSPLWSPAFNIACCVAVAWPVFSMYVLATRVGRIRLHQRLLALFNSQPAQILCVELDHIEGAQHGSVMVTPGTGQIHRESGFV